MNSSHTGRMLLAAMALLGTVALVGACSDPPPPMSTTTEQTTTRTAPPPPVASTITTRTVRQSP